MAQEVKNDIKKALQVNTIPLIAIMTAVTTVLTMLVKIPTPIRGYLNLSDTMILMYHSPALIPRLPKRTSGG